MVEGGREGSPRDPSPPGPAGMDAWDKTPTKQQQQLLLPSWSKNINHPRLSLPDHLKRTTGKIQEK